MTDSQTSCDVIYLCVHVLNSHSIRWKCLPASIIVHSEAQTNKSSDKNQNASVNQLRRVWALLGLIKLKGELAVHLEEVLCYCIAHQPVLTLHHCSRKVTLLLLLTPLVLLLFFFLHGSCPSPQMFPLPFQSGPNERDICPGGWGCL